VRIVANTVPNVLDHILPSHDLYRRRCLVVWIWSLLSVVLLLLLLLVAGLLIGLLADRGRLTIELPKDQVARFRELTGLPAGAEVDPPTVAADGQGGDVPVAADSTEPATPDAAADLAAREKPSLVHVSYLEYGILPAVWRSRDAWWGESLAWLFRHVELLQSNILAAMTLLLVGAILWTARHVCLSRLRAQARHVALEAVAPTRRNVHRQALRLGPEDLDGTGRANATELFVVDVENVRRGLARWIETDIRFPLELLCLALVAVSIQPLVAAQFLLFLGIAWYYLEAQDRRIESEGHQAANLANEELRHQSAGFQSARLVRGLGIEQMDHDHFATQLLKFHDLARRQDDFRDQSQFRRPRDVAACAAIGAFLLFILTTHILLQQSALSIASGSVFVATWLLAVPGTKALRRRRAVMHQASEAADKIQKYLDQIPTVSQAVGAHFLQPLTKSIHFDSVTYRNRAGHVLLDSLDLVLEAGRTYSLVSLDPLESIALASMLPRFIEPQRGRILFDGEDIAWATLESLRAETVFVGADEPLLPGTVLDNIRGGRSDYTLQQATEAAKLTHAHNFIVKMFDGYESELPERADLMDVAQRFRLGLARAMVRNPAVLIIEEPRIALDEDTKALLADAYDRICRDRTVIFLPGRMSTVRRSDQVLVLNEGRIAAIGPQSKLVNMSPIYRHWEYVNFNEFRHHET
jgi:ATP-binding cassette subfamily B protein